MNIEKEEAFETLKALLLDDDRKLNQSIAKHVNKIEEEYLSPDNFSKRVDERTDLKIGELKKNFSVIFKKELKDTVQKELKNSQDEVINALYPIIGKLISKFLRAELEKITERIDRNINDTFSLKTWQRRIQALFSGNSQSEIVLSELEKPYIEEVFVLENGSGLLIGNAALEENIDRDMVAGLLTAIKAFAEDAFTQKNATLSTIEYENLKLFVRSYHTITVAFVVRGIINNPFKERLNLLSDEFLEQLLSKLNLKAIDDKLQSKVSQGIENFFLKNKYIV